MTTAAHQYEDKLLEFAYGELSPHEADAVDAHVKGCATCAESLVALRAVRATMAQLPMEAAPEAGLDSLLAYAEQAARRTTEAKSAGSIWKRFLTPLVTVLALSTIGVVAWRANQEFDTSPASAAADTKLEARAQRQEKQKDQEAEQPAPTVPSPVVAAAPAQQEPREALAQKAAAPDHAEPAKKTLMGKGDGATPKAMPKPLARDDYSNAVQRGAGASDSLFDEVQGGAKAKDAAPPPPKTAEAGSLDKSLSFGLGSSGAGGSFAGDSRGSGPGVATESKKRAKEEQAAPMAEAAPMPSNAPVATPSAPPASKKPAARGSYTLSPLSTSGRSATSTADEDTAAVALEKSDSKMVDDEAKFTERQRAATRTQSLESARVASSRGDRSAEIDLLLKVLENGATGYEKAETLKRLCDAFEALGAFERADPYCDQLLNEFPNTVAAKVVTQRRNSTQRATPKVVPAKKASPADSY